MPVRRTPDPETRALIEARVAAWQPNLASEEHAPLLREWVLDAYKPATLIETDGVIGAVYSFARWAEQAGRAVTAESLLNPGTVDTYVAQAAALGANAKRAHRTALRRIVREHPAAERWVHLPAPPDNVGVPYTAAEADALVLWAQFHPKPARRHAMLAALLLGLGAGLTASDVTHVAGTDIRRDPATGAVLVTVRGERPRVVPVLARYEQDLLDLAAVAGSGWIVRPDRDPRTRRRPANFMQEEVRAAGNPTDAPRPTPARLRTTWLCHHLAARTRLDVLAKAAGLTTAESIANLANHLAALPAEEAVAMLRGPVAAGPGGPSNDGE